MNPFDYIRKLVEPNRTYRFNLKPDPKITRSAGLLAAFDGSPEYLGAPFTTGGIAPSSMNLSLRDYEMDSTGISPKEPVKSAVNMEQPKQVQNRLAENKSSDLSGKDIVKGLLKGLGAAAIGGMIGGESGVAAAGNILRTVEAKKQQKMAERAAMIREQQRMERTDTDRRMKEAELGLKLEDLDIKRQGMQQKAFNEGLGKVTDKIGGGLKAVFDYFKPPSEEKVQKIENMKKEGEKKELAIQTAKAKLAGTFPAQKRSGGGRSSGGKVAGKVSFTPKEYASLTPDEKVQADAMMGPVKSAAMKLKAKGVKPAPGKPQEDEKAMKQAQAEVRKLEGDLERALIQVDLKETDEDKRQAEKLRVTSVYAPRINKARLRAGGSPAPTTGPGKYLPPAAQAFIKAMDED